MKYYKILILRNKCPVDQYKSADPWAEISAWLRVDIEKRYSNTKLTKALVNVGWLNTFGPNLRTLGFPPRSRRHQVPVLLPGHGFA